MRGKRVRPAYISNFGTDLALPKQKDAVSCLFSSTIHPAPTMQVLPLRPARKSYIKPYESNEDHVGCNSHAESAILLGSML